MAGVWILAAVSSAALTLAAVSFLSAHPLTADTMMQWRLPGRLNEISGLAMSADGRLFAMDDEIAVVDALLDALGEGSEAAEIAGLFWKQADTFLVRRQEPEWTSRGKFRSLRTQSESKVGA